MNTERINQIIKEQGLPKFRAKQLKNAFFENHISSFDDLSTLSKDLRLKLSESYKVLSVSLKKLYRSEVDPCFKAILELSDGRMIETVLMSPKPGHWTTCISSQVGCALACTFCATGTMGLLRNLTSEEISDQVLFWRQFMKEEGMNERLNNVVYMGMGEPFQNRKNVFDSITELMNPETFGMGSRHISVSTSGLAKQILQMAEAFPQVNLALSLHSARDEIRSEIMPVINKANPLAVLSKALSDYIEMTNRKVFIEYILLKGETDSDLDVNALIDFVNSVNRPHLMHINLIVYNPTDADHSQSSKEQAQQFKHKLQKAGVQATIRKNLGRDIDGACGQLAILNQN